MLRPKQPLQENAAVREVEGDQALAGIQGQLGLGGQPLLGPQDLATAALAARDATHTALVFDVMAAAGHDFRMANL